MANSTVATGFTLIGVTRGSTHTARTITCYVGSGDSTAIYLGDAVSINNASGHGNDAIAGSGALEIKQAATTGALLGVVVGINFIRGVAVGSDNLNRVYRPANAAMYLNVCIDPDAIYSIKTSNGTAAITDMGKFAAIAATPSGSTTTGVSGMSLDLATISSSSTSTNMVVLGIDPSIDNTPQASNVNYLVRLVNTQIGSL